MVHPGAADCSLGSSFGSWSRSNLNWGVILFWSRLWGLFFSSLVIRLSSCSSFFVMCFVLVRLGAFLSASEVCPEVFSLINIFIFT